MRNTRKIANRDLIRNAFRDTPLQTCFTKEEIKNKLLAEGMEEGSILPSDYCYNRTNKDKDRSDYLRTFNIFIYVDSGQYEYLGENYHYTGPVIHKPRNEGAERVVGHYRNGKFFPLGSE